MRKRRYANMRERLNANSIRVSCGCQIWIGKTTKGGYPQLSIRVRGKVKTKLAHRVSLADHLGVKTWRLNYVHHQCRHINGGGTDNPACIDPIHLVSITQRKNLLERRNNGHA